MSRTNAFRRGTTTSDTSEPWAMGGVVGLATLVGCLLYDNETGGKGIDFSEIAAASLISLVVGFIAEHGLRYWENRRSHERVSA